MLGRLSKCWILSFFLELLEFSEDRHPWESVEEKLNAIRYELLVVCFDHSSVYPSFRPASLRPYPCPSVPASLPPSLPPLRFPFLLSSCLQPSIPASLPSTSLRPSVATSLPSSLSLPLSFSRFFLPPSFCLSIRPTLSPSLSPFLPHSFPPFLPPYATRSPLSSPNKLKCDISLSRCIGWFYAVFFSGLILVFLLTGQLSLFPFPFQRHDAKNGKRDEGWKRMKSYPSRWFQYDCFSCRVFSTSSNNNTSCLTSKQE